MASILNSDGGPLGAAYTRELASHDCIGTFASVGVYRYQILKGMHLLWRGLPITESLPLTIIIITLVGCIIILLF